MKPLFLALAIVVMVVGVASADTTQIIVVQQISVVQPSNGFHLYMDSEAFLKAKNETQIQVEKVYCTINPAYWITKAFNTSFDDCDKVMI